jgi:hypothetical protein
MILLNLEVDMNDHSLEQLRDERCDLMVRISLLEDRGGSGSREHEIAKQRIQEIEQRLRERRLDGRRVY